MDYFKLKDFELRENGRIYEKLGVKQVQWIVIQTMGRLHRKIRHVSGQDSVTTNYFLGKEGTRQALDILEKGTRTSEEIHLISIGNIIFGSFLFSFIGALPVRVSIPLAAIGVLSNASLCILQRYLRVRIHTILERKDLHQKRKHPEA